MAQDAMRSGDILFKVMAVFNPPNADPIEEVTHYCIGKPFFRPQLLILCRAVGNPPDLKTVAVHDDGQTEFFFCTSMQLCADLLKREAIEVCVSVERYELRGLNCLRLVDDAASNIEPQPVCLVLTLTKSNS